MRSRTILMLLVFPACGCGGPSEPPTYEVSGRVTWEGQPLEEGDIIFTAADNASAPASGKIEDGTYRIRSLPGKKLVSIRASRLVPGSKGAMGEPIFDNFIPDRFNVKTTLTVDVKTDQESKFDFPLEKGRASRANAK
jgi:hypothetical protein